MREIRVIIMLLRTPTPIAKRITACTRLTLKSVEEFIISVVIVFACFQEDFVHLTAQDFKNALTTQLGKNIESISLS